MNMYLDCLSVYLFSGLVKHKLVNVDGPNFVQACSEIAIEPGSAGWVRKIVTKEERQTKNEWSVSLSILVFSHVDPIKHFATDSSHS